MRRSFAATAAGVLFLRGNNKFARAESFSAAAKKKEREKRDRKKETTYRIFSINSSSGSEDLWNSTW
jgi:hypothetical protein